jgi:hypothetical protein
LSSKWAYARRQVPQRETLGAFLLQELQSLAHERVAQITVMVGLLDQAHDGAVLHPGCHPRII